MAAPAFRAETNGGNSGATSLLLTKPTGTVENDILLFCINKENQNAFTWPSGFVQKQEVKADPGGTENHLAVAWKRAGGAEPSDYTASWTGSAWRNGILIAVSGAITTGDPHDPATASTFNDATSGTTLTLASITTTVVDVLIIGVGGNRNDRTFTSSDLTERADIRTVWTGDVAQAVAGASGTKTVTLSSADINRMGILLGLKPPAAGGISIPVVYHHRQRNF